MPLLNIWNATCAVDKYTCPRQLDGIFFSPSGCKESQFYSSPFGQVVASINFTSPKFISTSPRNVLISRTDYTVPSVIWTAQKNFTSPSGKLRTEFTSLIAKSTSPGLSDNTFFAPWTLMKTIPSINTFCQQQREKPSHPLTKVLYGRLPCKSS